MQKIFSHTIVATPLFALFGNDLGDGKGLIERESLLDEMVLTTEASRFPHHILHPAEVL